MDRLLFFGLRENRRLRFVKLLQLRSIHMFVAFLRPIVIWVIRVGPSVVYKKLMSVAMALLLLTVNV